MYLEGNGRARSGVAAGAEPEDDGGGPPVPAGRLGIQGAVEEAGRRRMQVRFEICSTLIEKSLMVTVTPFASNKLLTVSL